MILRERLANSSILRAIPHLPGQRASSRNISSIRTFESHFRVFRFSETLSVGFSTIFQNTLGIARRKALFLREIRCLPSRTNLGTGPETQLQDNSRKSQSDQKPACCGLVKAETFTLGTHTYNTCARLLQPYGFLRADNPGFAGAVHG